MNKLYTYMKPEAASNGTNYFAVLGELDSALLGKYVEVFRKRHRILEGYITYLSLSTLTTLTQKDLDLLPRPYREKSRFWSRAEAAFKGGLAGEYQIAVVGVSNGPLQDVSEEAPRKRRKYAKKGTPKKAIKKTEAPKAEMPKMIPLRTRSAVGRMRKFSLNDLISHD